MSSVNMSKFYYFDIIITQLQFELNIEFSEGSKKDSGEAERGSENAERGSENALQDKKESENSRTGSFNGESDEHLKCSGAFEMTQLIWVLHVT